MFTALVDDVLTCSCSFVIAQFLHVEISRFMALPVHFYLYALSLNFHSFCYTSFTHCIFQFWRTCFGFISPPTGRCTRDSKRRQHHHHLLILTQCMHLC